MRPRSRLLSKRELLLPTIREGTEEAVRELNEANALHAVGHGRPVSSEDYLLSICHLAHPTFPAGGLTPNNREMQRLDGVHQRPRRPSRLVGTTPSTFEVNHRQEGHAMDAQRGGDSELNAKLVLGTSDPLEYLYGHQSNLSACPGIRRAFMRQSGREGQARSRAHSIPQASNPGLPQQRKGSCPEIHGGSHTIDAADAAPNATPKRSPSGSGLGGGGPADGEGTNPAVKQSLISQWISDCRAAWREARVRACMLPAIAEI